tara:strand:+ start:1747 stop:2619 length:873 start_codon:yes stop_codon:yes gene_type:complete
MSNFKKKPPNNTWLQGLHHEVISPSPSFVISNWKIKGCDWDGPYYAECGEDGILKYIFTYIDDKHKFAVDIGAAHGYGGSNIRMLVDKYGWDTTEFESRPIRKPKWSRVHPSVKKMMASPDNICEKLLKYNTPEEFDLLSLDIDSNDWYVLKSILYGGFKPSVIILEYNPIFNNNQEYVRNLNMRFEKDGTSAYGASLRAFEKLLNRFDHSLIWNCYDNKRGVQSNNAIFLNNKFIRDDDKISTIKELHPEPWKEPWKNNPISNEPKKIIEELVRTKIMKKLTEEDYEVS